MVATGSLRRRWWAAALAGAGVGVLGGLIGLGGAEFRLPLLVGLFGFAALQAVILNKAMSLVVVCSALAFRSSVVPPALLFSHAEVVVNLLGGSLMGAWMGAGWATRLSDRRLYRVIALMLFGMAVVLLGAHDMDAGTGMADGAPRVVMGLLAGFGIGVVAAVMGVAGGELLIPTLVLLFGLDVKLAGSLSAAVSLPTMLVGFARYSRDASFTVLRQYAGFAVVMAASSIAGAAAGGMLLGIVSSAAILPVLAAILLVSAVKMWRHA